MATKQIIKPPLPPMEYTIQDFKKWCKHIGHDNALRRLSDFQIYCMSGSTEEHNNGPASD